MTCGRRLYTVAVCVAMLLHFCSCAATNWGIQSLGDNAEHHPSTPSGVAQGQEGIGGLQQATQDLSQYRIYMVGETHAVVGTYTAQLEMIRYFYEQHNVRTLLLESGYASGALKNRYLQTGEVSILNRLMANLPGTSANSQQTMEFYMALRRFNQDLPADQRLQVYGVDVEHQLSTGIFYLASLLPSQPPPAHIAPSLEGIQQELGDYQQVGELILTMEQSIQQDQAAYQSYLGDAFQEFSRTLAGLVQGMTYRDSQNDDYREQCFTDNALAIIQGIEGKCLGLFGSYHTNMDSSSSQPTVGQALAQRYGTGHEGVASIRLSYYRSYAMDYRGKKHSIRDKYGKALSQYSERPFSLFALSADHPDPVVAELAQGQQYALLIQNSPATDLYHQPGTHGSVHSNKITLMQILQRWRGCRC